ncbi:sulfotransferase 1E1-like [Physella acuta]|uniref:sulfotransferase 1E1-like n=1 Tax=Physella acuta TaxID=109671 RepID=UPI0027DC7EDB|nr:sulfotransferase 1E1-like [Physella acuta]
MSKVKEILDDLPDEIMKNTAKLSLMADRFGNTFYFGNAGSFWSPPFRIGADTDYRTHARSIRDMEIRPDDVMICSYPKTGLHWQQEIINMLMHKADTLSTKIDNNICFLDSLPVHVLSTRESPRLLVTHMPFKNVPKQALEKKIKIVYLDRNPKDVLVSYYNQVHKNKYPVHYPGTFEQFVYLNLEVGFRYGDLFTYLIHWQDGIDANPDVPIYKSVYEDVKLDEKAGVKKLNEFLGTGCSEELCEKIAEACNFDRMKPIREANSAEEQNSFKISSYYRKGAVGDWKNWFTEDLNEEFDREYKKHMADYRTVYKYTLD